MGPPSSWSRSVWPSHSWSRSRSASGSALQLVTAPVFVAVVLSATGLGTLTPIFEDAPEVSGVFYRLVSTAAAFGEFTPILVLTLLFSRQATGVGTRLLLLAAFAGLALAVGLALFSVGESQRVRAVLTRLQDTTAQIRIRIAVVLFVTFAALAGVLGLGRVHSGACGCWWTRRLSQSSGRD